MDNETKTVSKQDLENIISDLLMARGYLDAKGKGFKQKGIDHLNEIYMRLHALKES